MKKYPVGAGRSGGTDPRRRKPKCIEPGVWDQSVGHSVLGIGKAISKKAYANSSFGCHSVRFAISIQLDFEIMEKLQLI